MNEQKQKLQEKIFASVIFLQNSQNFADFRGNGRIGKEGFFDSSKNEMIDYLSQWDTGGYGETYNSLKKIVNSGDTVYTDKKRRYVLTYNSNLGYARLYAII